MTKSIILGAGTYGEVYLHYLRESGVEVVGFLDDDPAKAGASISGAPVLGGMAMLAALRGQGVASAYAPIGDNAARRRLLCSARELGFQTPGFVHASAIVASDVKCGSAVYMLAGVIILPLVTLGDDVMIGTGARVVHHAHIRSGVFLATGATIGAGILVEEEAWIGMNAVAVAGKCRVIGARSIVGACSNLVADVPAGVTVAGNPARVLR